MLFHSLWALPYGLGKGGVLILVDSKFISEKKTEYKSACEKLRVQLNLTGSNSVLIGACYNPHELDQLSFEMLNKCLTLIKQTQLSGFRAIVIQPSTGSALKLW